MTIKEQKITVDYRKMNLLSLVDFDKWAIKTYGKEIVCVRDKSTATHVLEIIREDGSTEQFSIMFREPRE